MNLTVRTKVAIAAVLGVLALLLVVVFFNIRDNASNIKDLKASISADIKETTLTLLESKERLLKSNLKPILMDKEANSFLKNGDRDKLLSKYETFFKEFKEEYDIQQFQYNTIDPVVFLRLHNPKKFGDDLSSYRPTVVEANKTKKIIEGIDVGTSGLGLRVVAPVIFEGEHIGSVELGSGLESILSSVSRSMDLEYAVGINNDVARVISVKSDEKAISVGGAVYFTKSENVKNIIPKIKSDSDQIDNFAIFKVPLKDYSGKDIGHVLYTHDLTHEFTEFRNALIKRILAISLIGLLIIFGIVFVLFRALKPLGNMNRILQNISTGEGDLSQRIEIRSKDEIGLLAGHFNTLIENLENDFIKTVYGISNVSEKSNPIWHGLIEVRNAAEKTGDMSNQVATASEEMSSTIMEIARSSQESAENASSTVEIATKGGQIVDEVASYAESVKFSIDELRVSIANLTEDAKKIGNVINVINDIADQTNLLALNAAIEAARAGEAGRGFAVVADEVRKLAEKTQTSTKEIESMVKMIQNNVKTAYDESGNVTKVVEKQSELAVSAKANFTEILSSIENLNSLIMSISSAVEQQSSATEQIARSVVSVSEMSNSSKTEVFTLQELVDTFIDELAKVSDEFNKFKFSKKGVIFVKGKFDHIKFMNRIFGCLVRGKCDSSITDHRNCNFGKFYYSDSAKEFVNDSEFRNLEKFHIDVHRLGKQITDNIKAGKKDSAMHELPDMLEATKNVVHYLDQLMEKYR